MSPKPSPPYISPPDAAAEPSAPSLAPAETGQSESARENQEAQRNRIDVKSEAADASETDVAVNLVTPAQRKNTRRKRESRPQLGKKAVRIDISGEAEAPAEKSDKDDEAAAGGALKIPIDPK